MTDKQFRVTFDIEANGYLEDADRIHCLVAKDLDRGRLYSFYDDPTIEPYSGNVYSKDMLPRFFDKVTMVIGHNLIKYDLPLLNKLYGIEQSFIIADTLIWSKTLYPDRPCAPSQPTVLWNPVTKKNEKIGPHSLAAWGYRLDHPKVEYFDWETFDQAMLWRCTEDVYLNEKVYLYLLAEAGLT